MAVKPTRRPRRLAVGSFVEEWLDNEGITQTELANRLGISAKQLSRVLNGHVPVSDDLAARLDRTTGISAEYWLTMDAHYRASQLAPEFTDEEINAVEEAFPTKVRASLRKLGYVNAHWRNRNVYVDELLRFFGCGSVGSLTASFEPRTGLAFRQTQAFEARPGAVMAWLRIGALQVHDAEPLPAEFSPDKLRHGLNELRSATRGPVENFIPIATSVLNSAGIRFVVTPDVDGTRCSGVSRMWRGNPLIQVTPRHKREDIFWFTVFHEIAHVLNDDISEPLIAFYGDSSQKENEADSWASETMIPAVHTSALQKCSSLEDVIKLANDIGISPGIVMGRIHYEGIRSPAWGNKLIRKIRLTETER